MTEPLRMDQQKMDADLLQLLSDRLFDRGATFPVIVTAVPGCLSAVEESVIEHGGQVRHRLEPLEKVSAWLTMAAIAELSLLDSVGEMEMSKPMRIATAPSG